MTLIREAAEDDNDALIGLQKKCPMGTDLVLGVDSSPDYFARSKSFRNWHVSVAVENGTITGSAAYAISDTYVGGKRLKAAYEYGFIVDPIHRRKGIAEKLQRHIEHNARNNGVDILHLDILEGNTPSIRLFSKMGFEKVKDCTTFSLIPNGRLKTGGEADSRIMGEGDVEDVTNLINEMYRDYDFFTPFQPKDFLEYLKSMPGFGFHNVFVLRSNGNLEACLGYWDNSKVRRYIVEKMNRRLQIQVSLMRLIGLFSRMPSMPRIGEPLTSYSLAIMACRNPGSMSELVECLSNTALENKVNLIQATVDPKNPIALILSKSRHAETKTHFFIKSLRQRRLPGLGERRLYIDAAEL